LSHWPRSEGSVLLPGRGSPRRLVRQEAVAKLMHGWLLVLTPANLILADAIVWFAIAQGWP